MLDGLLVFLLDIGLAVAANFYFDFYGFAVDDGGNIGCAFGHGGRNPFNGTDLALMAEDVGYNPGVIDGPACYGDALCLVAMKDTPFNDKLCKAVGCLVLVFVAAKGIGKGKGWMPEFDTG